MASIRFRSSTDEEEEYRRPGFSDRFLVCHPQDGFVMSFPTAREARERAVAWDKASGYEPGKTEVFDRMARRGRVDTWRLVYAPEPKFKPIHIKPF